LLTVKGSAHYILFTLSSDYLRTLRNNRLRTCIFD